MARKRVPVQQLAVEAGIDLDEALISLWDAGFSYVNGAGDLLRRGDVNRARRLLGLATRRELSSAPYWQGLLGITDSEFSDVLIRLGIAKPDLEARLPKKAIHRLRAELRRVGKSPFAEALDMVPAPAAVTAPFPWPLVGHVRELRCLSADQVLAIHRALVDDFREDSDPIDPPGVRSDNLLASAVFRPHTAVGKQLKYPTIEMAAAGLLHGLVHDHPFHNGNKRTALVSMLVFLDENGILLTCDQDALFKLVLQLAQHALTSGPRNQLPDRETIAVAEWVSANSRWAERGDRPLQWRRLRRILTQYGCEFHSSVGDANLVSITRTVQRRKGILGRERPHVLRAKVYYGDEGREIDKATINSLRHDLELDDLNGIDSRAFYDNDPISVSEFIVNYRKTLRRLARL